METRELSVSTVDDILPEPLPGVSEVEMAAFDRDARAYNAMRGDIPAWIVDSRNTMNLLVLTLCSVPRWLAFIVAVAAAASMVEGAVEWSDFFVDRFLGYYLAAREWLFSWIIFDLPNFIKDYLVICGIASAAFHQLERSNFAYSTARIVAGIDFSNFTLDGRPPEPRPEKKGLRKHIFRFKRDTWLYRRYVGIYVPRVLWYTFGWPERVVTMGVQFYRESRNLTNRLARIRSDYLTIGKHHECEGRGCTALVTANHRLLLSYFGFLVRVGVGVSLLALLFDKYGAASIAGI